MNNKIVFNEPTFKGFVKFVNNQPADQTINHDSWESCAIGDYLHSIGRKRENAELFSTIDKFNFSMPDNTQVQLCDRLNLGRSYISMSNYGKLSVVLNEYVKLHRL